MYDKQFLLKRIKPVKIKNPVVLQGLPGMGNVGKISVDFIIQATKAQKIYEIRSALFPSYAFINKENLLDVPKIEIHLRRHPTIRRSRMLSIL